MEIHFEVDRSFFLDSIRRISPPRGGSDLLYLGVPNDELGVHAVVEDQAFANFGIMSPEMEVVTEANDDEITWAIFMISDMKKLVKVNDDPKFYFKLRTVECNGKPTLEVRCGRATVTIVGIEAHSGPSFVFEGPAKEDKSTAVTLSGDVFNSMISRAVTCFPKVKFRDNFDYLTVDTLSDYIQMHATDGFRGCFVATKAHCESPDGERKRVVIARKGAETIAKAFKGYRGKLIAASTSNFFAVTDFLGRMVKVRTVDEDNSRADALLDAVTRSDFGGNTVRVCISQKDLKDALKTVGTFGDGVSICVDFYSSENSRFDVDADIEDARDEVTEEGMDPNLVVRKFDGKYLKDFVDNASGDIHIDLGNHHREAVKFYCTGDSDWTYYLMPMKLDNESR